jgi:hypothetical protein
MNTPSLQNLHSDTCSLQLSLHTSFSKKDKQTDALNHLLRTNHIDIFCLFSGFTKSDPNDRVLLTFRMNLKFKDDLNNCKSVMVERIKNHRRLYFDYEGILSDKKTRLKKLTRIENIRISCKDDINPETIQVSGKFFLLSEEILKDFICEFLNDR